MVKSKEDLEKICNDLSDQGFGYVQSYKLHDTKVNNIIHKSNKDNLDNFNERKLREKLEKLSNYKEIEEEARKHFNNYDQKDKIKELMSKFFLKQSDGFEVPSSTNPSPIEIKEWFYNKRKYNIPNGYQNKRKIQFYNLDKNLLKIRFSGYEWNLNPDFSKFYKLIFNEDPKSFKADKLGEYQDLGKISIKIFANGNADIKGDLSKLKELHFNSLKNKKNDNIIRYNHKNYCSWA